MSGVSALALSNIEVNGSDPKRSTVQKLYGALAAAGVEFIEDEGSPGVRLRGAKAKR